ncbi:TolC family protein [Dyadobacter sp. CY356]|uniref:TolC family protein n=1 Tax=Dyadobacter sp. CY356 TaxID=2906442 RepID=UPI001F1EB5F9|nr:TolC family protein [Dyadobacter sp. CY356]MCF0054841.1 TolC family protein [Dyadobacter sp. CY356]
MKRFIFILLIGFSTVQLHAQQVPSDLKILINQSFTYFPAFKELDQAIVVENQRIDLARAAGLPTVGATGSYTYLHPVSEISLPIGDQVTKLSIMPNNNYKTMVNGSYTLWDFGVVKTGVERAKAGLQYAKDNAQHSKNQMAFQVANIYYQIAYLKSAIAIQDSVISFLQFNKRDSEIKLKNGDALKYDVLSIQSSIDQENNRKIDLQNTLSKQYNLMQYATGVQVSKESTDFNFPAVSDRSDAAGILESAKTGNVEYQLLKDKIAMAEAELKMSQIQGKPSLVLNAGTGFANGYVPDINKFRYNYQAGITLNIPIYQGGRIKKQVSLSQGQLLQTKLAQQSLDNTFSRDIVQALTDIQSNKSSLVNALEQINEAKEAQKFAQSRFRNGTGTNLELTNASTNVQRAELTRLQYQYQLCLASLELARLEGLVYW